MKKNLFKYAAIFFLITFFSGKNLVYSQDVKYELKYDTLEVKKTKIIRIVTLRTIPKFILQINAAYNSGALELTGHNGGFSWLDFAEGRNYGARNGYGFTITGKMPLHKKGNFWIGVTSGYNRFQSDLVASNTEEGKVAYNVFNGGFGADYNFTPSDKVKYFVGGNILGSVIWGNALLIPIGSISDLFYKELNINIKSSFRLGYSVHVGLEYAFERSVGMNIGFKFTHANLLLKNSSTPTDLSETGLNDDASNAPMIYSGWKQFAYISVFGGISFYFGVKDKRYKLP